MGSFEKRLQQRVADRKLVAADVKEKKAMPEQQTQPAQQPAAAVPQRPKNILERMTDAEADIVGIKTGINNLVAAIDPVLGQIKRQQDETSDVVNALVEVLGKDAVTAVINKNLQREAEERVAAEKRGLEKLLKDGAVVPVEEAAPGCFIIAVERDKDGNPVMTPGYRWPVGFHQRFFEGFTKDAQESIKGQKVGFVRKDEKTESTFTIEGIYRFVEKTPEEADKVVEDLEAEVDPSAAETPAAEG